MIEYIVRFYSDGSKSWLLNGKSHREDGPAYEHPDGTKWYYLNGTRYTEDEWKAKLAPVELTVAQISELLGYEVKVIK